MPDAFSCPPALGPWSPVYPGYLVLLGWRERLWYHRHASSCGTAPPLRRAGNRSRGCPSPALWLPLCLSCLAPHRFLFFPGRWEGRPVSFTCAPDPGSPLFPSLPPTEGVPAGPLHVLVAFFPNPRARCDPGGKQAAADVCHSPGGAEASWLFKGRGGWGLDRSPRWCQKVPFLSSASAPPRPCREVPLLKTFHG